MTRYTYYRKKQCQEFHKLVSEGLLKRGATPKPNEYDQFVIDTPGGPLALNPEPAYSAIDNPIKATACLMVFGAFLDHIQAMKVFPELVNRNCAKWCPHYRHMSPSMAASQFLFALDGLMRVSV